MILLAVSNKVPDNTPVLIGSGQVVKRDIVTAEQTLSPVELATEAAQLAIKSCGYFNLAGEVDTLAVVRAMIDNRPETKHPFGTTFGMVSANGGYLSKQSIGIYSTEPAEAWQPVVGNPAQQALNQQEEVKVPGSYKREGIIESYSLMYSKGEPGSASIVARTLDGRQRFLAKIAEGDHKTLLELQNDNPGSRHVMAFSKENECFFSFKTA